MRITASTNFELREATQAVLSQFKQPPGTLELIDFNGDRVGFFSSKGEAQLFISRQLENLAFTFEVFS